MFVSFFHCHSNVNALFKVHVNGNIINNIYHYLYEHDALHKPVSEYVLYLTLLNNKISPSMELLAV